jgi:hypothetical protein
MLNRPLYHSKRVHRSTRRGIFERRVLAMVFVSPLSLQKVRPPICPRVTHRIPVHPGRQRLRNLGRSFRMYTLGRNDAA